MFQTHAAEMYRLPVNNMWCTMKHGFILIQMFAILSCGPEIDNERKELDIGPYNLAYHEDLDDISRRVSFLYENEEYFITERVEAQLVGKYKISAKSERDFSALTTNTSILPAGNIDGHFYASDVVDDLGCHKIRRWLLTVKTANQEKSFIGVGDACH